MNMNQPAWHKYPSIATPTFEVKYEVDPSYTVDLSRYGIDHSHNTVHQNPSTTVLNTSNIKKDLGAHYKYSYKGIKVDPYRIFCVYNISHPAQQHAIKKLLRAGTSLKSLEQDIEEVIITLTRWKEMIEEDKS